MRGLAAFDSSSLGALLEPMRKREAKMSVERWDYSEAVDLNKATPEQIAQSLIHPRFTPRRHRGKL
jgi:hypothetical protein